MDTGLVGGNWIGFEPPPIKKQEAFARSYAELDNARQAYARAALLNYRLAPFL